MRHFSEFVSQRDGAVADPSIDNIDQDDLLQRIIRMHGQRFRIFLRDVIRRGDLDDDKELLGDIKQLYRSIGHGTPDQFPPTKRPEKQEPDIVSRPKADGGGDLGGQNGQGEGGGGSG